MPKKYASKKRTKKTYKKKSRKTVFRPQRILSTAFPKTTAVRLRYVDTISLDATQTTMAQHFYKCNSVFDPDETGTGHQPMGFDEWANLYQNYVVIGSVLKATTSGMATTAGAMNVLGITVSNNTTVSDDLSTYMEQSRTNRAVLSRSYAAKIKSVRKGFSTKKNFNVTNVTDNIGILGAPITADPSSLAYWCVSFGGVGLTGDIGTQPILIEIEYTVIFSNPKQLTQS